MPTWRIVDPMAVRVACISCHSAFDVVAHAGLVRCDACEGRLGLRLPGQMGGTTITVLDTPGEAWAAWS